ncbi:FKBP-type peptidyl-prolyl cis-trans isomerase [Thiocystis violacea]|uniref:FKBP-type peptidyl-prolyl cis-trans isomerase n=1 Tax=Thiocystis violacea TaxID=13725 RepID=UPI001903BF01|nr:peptidylprolyl isomerase [Thiocystis violacea]
MQQQTETDQTATPVDRGISPGCGVCLHLEVRFHDGLIALSTFEEDPIRCRIGDGTFTPAFEAHLQRLRAGADTELVANGSDLFGTYDEANHHWVDQDDFPEQLHPTPGQVVSFASPGGDEVSGIILAVEDGRVQVDFNHPLSGRPLWIRIQVLAVEPQDAATPADAGSGLSPVAAPP